MAARLPMARARHRALPSSLFYSVRLFHSATPVATSAVEASPSSSSLPSSASLASSIRSLMRASAQPVAVITTLLPPASPSPSSSQSSSKSSSTQALVQEDRREAHGATLSSFTTVSLEPALVAFSIRTPSRMADALEYDYGLKDRGGEAHFVINILSLEQEDAAQGFAKPGLEPWDLVSSSISRSSSPIGKTGQQEQKQPHPFSFTPIHASRVARARDGQSPGVPVFTKSLGALACSIVRRIDLSQLDSSTSNSGEATEVESPGEASEESGADVFIAKVHAVEDLKEGTEEPFPLVYWQRKFTTVKE